MYAAIGFEEIVRRVCQLVESCVSGGSGKPIWDPVRRFVSVHSSSNMVPLSMKSLVLRKAKEGVETEHLRLCTVKTVPVLEDGEWETPAAPHMPVLKSKSKGKGKEGGPRQLAAAFAEPSDPGSTGLEWAAEEQHWVPLFNTISEVPTLNLSCAPHNSYARLRQRLCREHCCASSET